MAERPILFSSSMIRALLDGRKSQTRRIYHGPIEYREMLSDEEIEDMERRGFSSFDDPDGNGFMAKPQVNWRDRLWVREAWNIAFRKELAPGEVIERTSAECSAANRGFACAVGDGIVYKATGAQSHPQYGKALWRSPLHLSRWGSRLTLIVTDVRVQRLQEISEAEAIAEGVDDRDPVCGYSELWDSLNASRGYGWGTNPWVVAITFDVHRENIDARPASRESGR